MLLAAIFVVSPAHATGGLVCATASGQPTRISFVIGHGEAGGILSAHRLTGREWRNATVGQSWISDRELKVDLVDTSHNRRLVRIEARRNGYTYDGTVTEAGKRRWIRCREG